MTADLKASFEKIKKYNGKINALITVVEGAQPTVDGLLSGKTFVLKDSYLTKGIKTTAASNVLRDYVGQYNATVYQKLLDAGATLVGKANMDAWGHGATNENSDFGPVRNPYDLTRSAGGSGGGPAAAVTTGMADFGIGEDTGGSIRNPAAWCNITALKVTYGRVSRYGCIAYASSFDSVGPTAITAQDCALILKVIAGRDKHDATSSPEKVDDYPKMLGNSLRNLRLGWPEDLFSKEVDPEIRMAIEEAKGKFEKMGMEIIPIKMPLLFYGISLYYVIAPSETSSNLSRYDGLRFGNDRTFFGAEAKRRIMMGTYALSSGYYDAYYKKAQQVRTLLIEEYKKAFDKCDVILMPVMPCHPNRLGEFENDPIKNMLIDIYTVTQNTAGVPSIALPCGFSKTGLPIGMQVVGKMFSEGALLNVGYQFQQVTNWHNRRPKI
jgi:aspartyl-tRNA(Asn)/glutamyl-tRNA(Gln) amidotransferase subunit A